MQLLGITMKLVFIDTFRGKLVPVQDLFQRQNSRQR